MATQVLPRYCFGPYELDLDRRELRKFGTRVSLQPQCYQVLVCLLEKSGRTVTRAELQRALCGQGVHVDFERSLNRIINKLRSALGDIADSPKYIETMRVGGYQFIGHVSSVGAAHSSTTTLATSVRLRETVISLPPSSATKGQETSLLGNTDASNGELAEAEEREIQVRIAREGGRSKSWTISVAAIMVLAGAVTLSSGRFGWGSSHPAHLRVEVLPTANETGNAAEDYLALGETIALTDELTGIAGDWLEVIEPPSMQYNDGRRIQNALKNESRPDYVIEGSLSRASAPTRVRLAAKLVRVQDHAVVWSASSECSADDATIVQKQLAESAAQALSGRPLASPSTRAPVPPHARQEYLLGRYLANKRNKDSTLEAAKHFDAAIQMDPTFTAAYLGVADAQLFLANYIPSYAQAARASLLKALQLDSSSAEAHAQLGFLKFTYDLDYQAAEKEFRQALQLEPGSPSAHYRYGLLLAGIRRYPEAVEQMQRALELDPLNQSINYNSGIVLFQAGRTDDAIRQLQRTLELEPESEVAHQYLGIIFEQQKRYDAALDEFRKAAKYSNGHIAPLIAVGHVQALAGHTNEARKVLQELQRLSHQQFVRAYGIALLYVALNDRDNAFRWLDKAIEDGSCSTTEINNDQNLDPIRGDRRFSEIQQRLGLPIAG